MLNETLQNHQVIINCGCGGVGKTTTSAALGIRAASLGLKVIVLTIDPAKRLADSLGIGALSGIPKRVPLPPEVPGEMWAMMLDVQNTIDTLISRNAHSESQAKAIFSSHIYQQGSQAMGGAQEYGAMEQLFQIYTENQYELIILDTPPSQHVIDFVTAPLNLKEFFSQSWFKYFLEGTHGKEAVQQRKQSLTSMGKNMALKYFEKLTGSHFLGEISFFLENFYGMYENIRNEATLVSDLLASPKTGFLIVTGPDQQQLMESRILLEKLVEFHLPFKGFIVNKCTPNFGGYLNPQLPPALYLSLRHVIVQQQRHSTHESKMLLSLLAQFPQEAFVHKVPIISKEVYNIETLMKFNELLDA
ncbi:ArsA-related P-loop ATPase [Deltaproteobacteria bacterium TL4]